MTHFKKYRLANYQKEQRLKALQAQGAVPLQLQAAVPRRDKNDKDMNHTRQMSTGGV